MADADKLVVHIVAVDHNITNMLEFTTSTDDLTARTILGAVAIIDDM
jgi:hypothetical protein